MKHILTIIACTFFLSQIYSQDFTWEYINPWRYQNIQDMSIQNGKLYFKDKKNPNGDFIIHLRPDLSGFDTIFQEQNMILADFSVMNDETIYATTLISGFDWGLLKINPLTNDIDLLYESDKHFIYPEILDSSLFVMEKPYNGDTVYVSKLDKNNELENIFTFIEDGHPSYLQVIDDFVLFYNDKTCYFSIDKGITWDTIINQYNVDRVEVIDNDLVMISGQRVNIYNIDGELINFFKYENSEHPWFIGHIIDLKKVGERLYLSNEFFLQYSDDNGQSWVDLSESIDRFNRGGKIFNYQGKLLIESNKGLEYYDPITDEFNNYNANGINSILSIHAVNDSSYLVHQHGNSHISTLWRSTNNGLTWTEQLLEVNPPFSGTDNKLHYLSHDTLYITSRRKENIWRSTDGGLTWSLFQENLNMDCFVMSILSNDKFYCFDRDSDKILYSQDEGNEWSPMEIYTPTIGFSFPRFVKGKNNVDWMLDSNSDSVFIYKIENEKVIYSYAYENTVSQSFYSAYTNSEGLVFSNDQILLLEDNSNEVSIYVSLEDKPIILNQNDDFLIGIVGSNIYLYHDYLDNPYAELQLANGEAIGITYYSDNTLINQNGEVILVQNNKIIKYGPAFDKGIFVGPIETPYEIDEEIEIYPNPFRYHIFINSDKILRHELYSMNGQLILTSDTNQISTANIDDGMYIMVSYENNRRISVRKMVK